MAGAQTPNTETSSVSFQTEFAVDMTCQSCVNAVQSALAPLPGIEDISIGLEDKRVVVTGRTPPSVLCKALKDTGRQVLVRGSGSATGTHEGAAVAILETPLPALASHGSTEETQQVHGIARLVQVSTKPPLMLLDLTVRFPGYPLVAPTSPVIGSSNASNGKRDAVAPSYDVYVSSTGDVQCPPFSTGLPHIPLTTLSPDSQGYADTFLELPLGLWELVGRAMVIEPSESVKLRTSAGAGVAGKKEVEEKVKAIIGGKGRLGVLAGVIARSSGAWGNDKTVCACSGKSMWEEGRMAEARSKI